MFLKLLFWSVISVLLGHIGFAQRDNVWILGKWGVDFSSGEASPYTPPADISLFEGSASVCDGNGQLLFFTDGTHSYDKSGRQMPNGDALMGHPLSIFNSASTAQGAIIVPFPSKPTQYMVFSMTSFEAGKHYGKLFYSVVDMDLNGGYGDILPAKKGILLDSMLTETMTAVSGDNCNVWLVVRSRERKVLKAFEITSSGLNTRSVISEAGLFGVSSYNFGEMQFSPDGKMMAAGMLTATGGGIEIFKFNRSTGVFSDSFKLDEGGNYCSVCFSPDNSKLFAVAYGPGADARPFFIYEFDLQTANPSRSKTVVDVVDYFYPNIRKGPDGRLYYAYNDTLAIISNPNEPTVRLKIEKKQFWLGASGLHTPTPLPNVIAEVKYDTAASITSVLSRSCWQDKILLQAGQEGWNYRWSDGSEGHALEVSEPGIYALSYYTAPCIYRSDTFLVSIPNGRLPKITINAACKETATGTIALQTNASDTVHYNYTWFTATGSLMGSSSTLDNLYSGTYRLHIQTAQCDTFLNLVLPESDYKVLFKADTLACTGTSLSFNNQSDNYFTQWSWTFGDGTVSTQAAPNHTYVQPGNYKVSLMASGPICRDTFSHRITVDAPMESFHLYSDRDTLCEGESITLHYNQDVTLIQYHWELAQDHSFPTRDTFLRHSFDKPGLQRLSLTAEFRACPEQQRTQNIFIAPMPRVKLGSDTFLCLRGSPITLSNQYAPQPGDRYLWSNGATTPDIQVQVPEHYQLQITNRYGCSSTESITVRKDCYTDVPNVFAPNGDGINDYFYPRQRLSSRMSTLHLQIWNRWGQLLFETREVNGRGWDGRWNGIEQVSGTYVFQLKVKYNNDQEELLQGNVTLVR